MNNIVKGRGAVRLIYALWLLLVVYLTVTAVGVKRDTRPHLGQSFGLTFALIAAFLLPRWPILRFVNFAPVNRVVSGIGVTICLVGMATLVWSRQSLGRNWSQTVAAKEDHELVTSGPYRWVRHPMYAGGLLAATASAVVAGGGFVFLAALLAAIFLWRVRAEDQLMEEQFPNAYPEYKKRTKALIPFVW